VLREKSRKGRGNKKYGIHDVNKDCMCGRYIVNQEEIQYLSICQTSAFKCASAFKCGPFSRLIFFYKMALVVMSKFQLCFIFIK